MPGIDPRRDTITAAFAEPGELLSAVRGLRAGGHEIVDTFTPFPVHGMDEAMGLRRTRIPFSTGAFALAGLLFAIGFQWWSSVADYPIVIGGKPLNSLPAFLPITFELTVLFAALGSVATLFVRSRLFPRLRVKDLHAGASDDRFILAARLAPGAEREGVLAALRHQGALAAGPWVEDYFAKECSPWDRELGPAGLALCFAPALAVLALIPLLGRDYGKRNIAWDAGMMRSPGFAAYTANPILPNGQTLQNPVPGTKPRGFTPDPYGATPEEAARAGLELKNPLAATPAQLARGAQLFNRICATCHGPKGLSDGPIIPKFPNPPSLQAARAKGLPDGRIFHIATHGQGLMKGYGDVLNDEDRWSVVLHIRALQGASAPPASAPASAPATASASAPASAPAAAPGAPQ